MLNKLIEILDEEEIYIASFINALDRLDTDKATKKINDEIGKATRSYFKRIKDRIQKEVINEYGNTISTTTNDDRV